MIAISHENNLEELPTSSDSSSSVSGLLKIQLATVVLLPKPISNAVSKTEARSAFESRFSSVLGVAVTVFKRGSRLGRV
jgi:hypothetical protein